MVGIPPDGIAASLVMTMVMMQVGLYLYHQGEPILTIVKSIRNLGKYIYTIPDTLQPGQDYQILVIAEEPKLPDVHSFTETFTVAPRALGMLSKVPPAIPTINVTFPARPNWSWPCGSSYNITWTDSGSIGVVQIDVVRRGVFAFRIIGSLLNVGGFQYALPLDSPTGDAYQVGLNTTLFIVPAMLCTPIHRPCSRRHQPCFCLLPPSL